MNSGDPVSSSFKSYWLVIVGTVERLFAVPSQCWSFFKTQFFLAFDLNDLAVVNRDLNRAKTYPLDGLHDLQTEVKVGIRFAHFMLFHCHRQLSRIKQLTLLWQKHKPISNYVLTINFDIYISY
jgi:hypothetical protein